MDEIERKLHELELGIKMNTEQSNSRMDRVNTMISGVITIMQQAIEQQKVINTALTNSQKFNEELLDELREVRKRCSDKTKEIKALNELIRTLQTGNNGIKIENHQS